MKIIAFNRLPGEQIDSFGNIDVIPDSAMILPGKPLFLPDFVPGDWLGAISVAFHINRLGKNISSRFASRYYDGITLAMRVFPQNKKDDLACRGLLSACDGTFVHGEWREIPQSSAISVSGDTTDATVTFEEIDIDRLISTVSRFMTLKTGDIILATTLPQAIPLAIGDTITLNIDNSQCLNLRIK